MSDFELVSGPSSPRSYCSNTSSHISSADRSAYSSTAAVYAITSTWAENARPLPQQPKEQAPPNTIGAHQQCTMPSIKPKLSMRPISTPVNLLVCGATGSGKSSFISAFIRMLNAGSDDDCADVFATKADEHAESWKVSGTGPSADPHAVLLAGPDQFAAAVGPIPVPEAGRELLYRLQDCPGHGATLDPAGYLEALLTFLLQQQKDDFDQLQGSRGMPKSLVCGSLAHSITACLYFLPPAGPSKLDLVLMAGLSRHVALLPVVGRADSMTPAEAESCCKLVQHMLAAPAEYVAGLETIHTYKPAVSELPFLLHTRSSAGDAAPGHAAAAGQANLGKLVELLTGDEVYGLLDHAWDMYTAFCSAYKNVGSSSSIADMVSHACAAATQTCMPSCAAIAEVQQQLQQEQEESSRLRIKLCNVQNMLDGVTHKAERLQVEVKTAEADSKKASSEKEHEGRLLDELWRVFKAYRSHFGHSSYPVSQYAPTVTISADSKKRLPKLS